MHISVINLCSNLCNDPYIRSIFHNQYFFFPIVFFSLVLFILNGKLAETRKINRTFHK